MTAEESVTEGPLDAPEQPDSINVPIAAIAMATLPTLVIFNFPPVVVDARPGSRELISVCYDHREKSSVLPNK
jgi:hypothetical protein